MKQCPCCKHNVPDNDAYCRYCNTYLAKRAQYRPTNNSGYAQASYPQNQVPNITSYNPPPFEYDDYPKRGNGAAVAGFVLSFFLPLLGLIFGCIGNSKANRGASGKGLSVAAIILSFISLIVEIAVIGLFIYANFYYVEEVEEIFVYSQRWL